MKHILHDWDDPSATRILKNCRASMEPGKRLLLLEAALREGNDPNPAKWLDLQMMTALGGIERTEAEWRTLLRGAAFEVTKILPTRTMINVIEVVAR